MRFVAVINDVAGDQHVFGTWGSRTAAHAWVQEWMPNNAERYECEAYGVFPLLSPTKNEPRQQ
jgi:hypothetical protein